jgi:hypothetical protein
MAAVARVPDAAGQPMEPRETGLYVPVFRGPRFPENREVPLGQNDLADSALTEPARILFALS